jgi:predicted HD superfamily hydrolase involved in NAD metabolism
LHHSVALRSLETDEYFDSGQRLIPANDHPLPTRLRAELQQRIAPKRLAHVMGVEGLSVSLALQWGLDPRRAMVAALLHDYCKEEPREKQLDLTKSSRDFPPGEEDLQLPAMWHGMAAASLARSRFGIDDPEILEAVAWHTTGNPRLGPLGLTLYVSDFLEPTRHFDGVERYRQEILPMGLHEAALRVANLKLANVRNRNRQTHTRTIRMKEWLENGH